MKIHFAIITILLGCLVHMSYGQGYIRLARRSNPFSSMIPRFAKWKNMRNEVMRKDDEDMYNDGHNGLPWNAYTLELEKQKENEKKRQQKIKNFIFRHPKLMERYHGFLL